MSERPLAAPAGSSPSPWRTIDPREVPVAERYAHLPPVPERRLQPAWLRERVASPPPWEPERTGDQQRAPDRAWRAASVLVPIVLRAEAATVLLTQRPAHMREHAGQVAFPGGRAEATDLSPVDTALREAWEEIGLARERVDVIGRLPLYRTGTGYEVTPVVALVDPGLELRPDASEVADTFEVPLHFLMDPRHHERRRLVLPELERDFLAMPYRADGQERFIWGATAAMLRNLYRLLIA